MNFAIKTAKKLISLHKTDDLRSLCDELNIHIIKYDLPESVEGFFQNFYGKFIIYLNKNLDTTREKFVLGHELGHILMHDSVNSLFMKENSLFNVEKCENEANMFATYLLVDKLDLSAEFSMEFYELSLEKISEIRKMKENYVLL